MEEMHLKIPQFENKDLNKATQAIIKIYKDAAHYADQKNQEIAKILGTVLETKCYEQDGFKSVAEYAEFTFGIKKRNAYALASAGSIYNDNDIPLALKKLSPSKLAEVAKLDKDELKKAVNDGHINENSTQAELRDYASTVLVVIDLDKKTKKNKESILYKIEFLTAGYFTDKLQINTVFNDHKSAIDYIHSLVAAEDHDFVPNTYTISSKELKGGYVTVFGDNAVVYKIIEIIESIESEVDKG